MKKKIYWQCVPIPSRSEIRRERLAERIFECVDVLLSLDRNKYPYVFRLLDRESTRLNRILREEGYDD